MAEAGGDLDLILANIGHEDRFIRYAARVALENQPINTWRDSAFATKDTKAVLGAMLASRSSRFERRPRAFGRKTIRSQARESQLKSEQLYWLRTLEVAFARHGEPSEATSSATR